MHRRVFFLLVLGMAMCLPVTALAVPTIDLSAISPIIMNPNDSVDVTIFASNADLVGGMNWRNWINGGTDPEGDGPYISAMAGFADGDGTYLFGLGLGGLNTGPPDGVFGGGNTGTQAAGSAGGFANVVSNSLPLTKITLVTTGAAPGNYSWSLTNPGALGATTFTTSVVAGGLPITTIIIDGTITVVPEPGSVVLALFAAGGLAAVVIRRRRRRA